MILNKSDRKSVGFVYGQLRESQDYLLHARPGREMHDFFNSFIYCIFLLIGYHLRQFSIIPGFRWGKFQVLQHMRGPSWVAIRSPHVKFRSFFGRLKLCADVHRICGANHLRLLSVVVCISFCCLPFCYFVYCAKLHVVSVANALPAPVSGRSAREFWCVCTPRGFPASAP